MFQTGVPERLYLSVWILHPDLLRGYNLCLVFGVPKSCQENPVFLQFGPIETIFYMKFKSKFKLRKNDSLSKNHVDDKKYTSH